MAEWGGDPLPDGLTPDDRVAWPVAATVVMRYVPDPETGRARGLSMEYHGDVPKLALAHQLLSLAQELMAHPDFQAGVPLTGPDDDDDDERGDRR